MGSRRAESSRLRDGNEYAGVIETGRFAHAQHSCAAPIIAPRSGFRNKGEFTIQGIHSNLETLGTARQNQYRQTTFWRLTPESSVI